MIIFYHGLNSSNNSSKFKILKEVYKDIECFEWSTNDNIKDKLNNLSDKLLKCNDITLIGDSTGANFALQTRDLLKKHNKQVNLILLSPLSSINQIDKSHFIYEYVTDTLINNITDFKVINDALVIIPTNDEVLYNNYIFNNCEIIKTESSHRLEDFSNYINYIKNYIKL